MNCKFLNEQGVCRIKSKVCNKSVEKCTVLKLLNDNPPYYKLYNVRKDVICLKCGHKGAVQLHGGYYPIGLPKKVIESMPEIYGKYIDKPYMEGVVGFGGTIPYECTNCGNTGLIDYGGLEGYEMAFESIKDK